MEIHEKNREKTICYGETRDKIERRLFAMEKQGIKVNNCTWHDRYTLVELERDFKTGTKTYDDTHAKECLCAIY